MARRSIRDIETIWSRTEGIKKLSDRAIAIGPFGIGMDALLTWIPVVGSVYTVGAGLLLLMHGVGAKASPATLARMAGYLLFDTATGTVPIAGDIVDTLFPGHLMAAKALQKDIESTHWVEMSRREAIETGAHEAHQQVLRDNRKLRRIVYLHD
jgi:hypothetical protein